MLQKFALAFKTKTIEFFAEEEEEEEDDNGSIRAVDDLVGPTADAVITDQRVVVLRPDPAPAPSPAPAPADQNPNPSPPDPETLLSTLFATLSSFESAFLHFQTAHSPVLPADLCSADAEVVSHLRRLSDLKHSFHSPDSSSGPNSDQIDLTSCLQAQVLDNQNLLRTFDVVINRLQADIDRKDAEAAELRLNLNELELLNGRLAARLDRACAPPPGDENVENLLLVSVFDSVLRDSCRIVHTFAKSMVGLMRRSGWDLFSVAKSIYPDANYAKPHHCRYTILSHVCLRMFDGFNSYGFGVRSGEPEPDMLVRRNDSLRQFIEHSAIDPLELIGSDPNSEFAQFCERKYTKVIQPGAGSGFLGPFDPSSPLFEPYVNMASSIWALYLLARAYDPVVEIFQVGHGKEFSIVYMENILRWKVATSGGKVMRPKVGFTVIPGFRVGGTVIQCRVYLDPSS